MTRKQLNILEHYMCPAVRKQLRDELGQCDPDTFWRAYACNTDISEAELLAEDAGFALYACAQCGKFHDNNDPHDAQCQNCGSCPECSPPSKTDSDLCERCFLCTCGDMR